MARGSQDLHYRFYAVAQGEKSVWARNSNEEEMDTVLTGPVEVEERERPEKRGIGVLRWQLWSWRLSGTQRDDRRREERGEVGEAADEEMMMMVDACLDYLHRCCPDIWLVGEWE